MTETQDIRLIPLLESEDPILFSSSATSEDYAKSYIPKYKKVRGKKVQKGVREIYAPSEELKRLQKDIIKRLSRYRIGLHDAAHAYRRKRNIVTMAEKHVGKKGVLRLDLQNFFPSVTEEMVITRLPRRVPADLKRLIRNWCFLEGVLPQGAPSSPFLSNIALFGLDQKISKLLSVWRTRDWISQKGLIQLSTKQRRVESIEYSRYCDDLIFSSNYPYLKSLIPSIRKIIESYGLKVNPKKVRYTGRGGRQYVTGVIVNQKLSAPKVVRDNLRAEMHHLILDTANGRCPSLHRLDEEGTPVPISDNLGQPFSSLEGRIAFIGSVCSTQAEKLKAQLAILKEVHLLPAERWSTGTVEYIEARNG